MLIAIQKGKYLRTSNGSTTDDQLRHEHDDSNATADQNKSCETRTMQQSECTSEEINRVEECATLNKGMAFSEQDLPEHSIAAPGKSSVNDNERVDVPKVLSTGFETKSEADSSSGKSDSSDGWIRVLDKEGKCS